MGIQQPFSLYILEVQHLSALHLRFFQMGMELPQVEYSSGEVKGQTGQQRGLKTGSVPPNKGPQGMKRGVRHSENTQWESWTGMDKPL